MSETTPPPPKTGGSGPFIIAAVVMLLLMGGLILWKVTGKEPKPPEPPPPVASVPATPELEEPPPPPPPPIEEDAGKEPEKQIVKKGTVSGGSTCSAVCEGDATPQLQSALSGRAGQARGCYDRALRNNSMLEGRMTVAVKISSTGQVCSANVTKNELGDPGLTSCVLQMFRSGTFPQPKGGCVDAAVPLNFKKKD